MFVDKRSPSLNWYFRNETGPVSSIAFGYRILCAPDYYGPNCTIYCNARDDDHGHYGCNSHGDRYCLTGWTNIDNYCTKREYAIVQFSFSASKNKISIANACLLLPVSEKTK